MTGVANPERFGGLGGQRHALRGAAVAHHQPAFPAVMSPVDEGELNLLAVHAVVRLRVRDPDCRVVGRRLLTRLLQQIINTL